MILYDQILLRLLLSPSVDNLLPFRSGELDWDRLLKIARKNVVLLRTAEALRQEGVNLPASFAEASGEETQRVSETLPLIDQLGGLCRTAGIDFFFPKAFLHYPDMGHDVDLFVMDRSHRIDTLIIDELGGKSLPGSLINRISGKTGYEIPGYSTPVEVHHGRMGQMGEHAAYPRRVLNRRLEATVDGVRTWIPGKEDCLIIQAIQRIYGHFNIRLSDALHSTHLILEGGLDWEDILSTAKGIGVLDGLRCYLTYLSQICDAAAPGRLFPPEIERILDPKRWGTVRFNGSHYRFPILASAGRAFWKKLWTDLGAGNWESCRKICLIPPITAWMAVRHAVKLGK